jgi:flagellar motility protein MotE (MotC chaperone)
MKLRSLLPASLQRIGWKPPLITMMMGAAGISAIANAMASATPAAAPAEADVPTRLGTSIQQSLRERDQALAGQKRALDLREQAQRAAEQRLQSAMQSGQPATPASGTAPAPITGTSATPYDELARIYQAMKPAKAAPIFEKLELDVQIEVARRMRDRATALLLASMSPDGAAELSMAMAGRHVVKAPPPRVAARAEASAKSTPAPARAADRSQRPRHRAARAMAEQAATPEPAAQLATAQ